MIIVGSFHCVITIMLLELCDLWYRYYSRVQVKFLFKLIENICSIYIIFYLVRPVFVLSMIGRQACPFLRKKMCAADNVRVNWWGRSTEQPSLARSVDPRSRILFCFFLELLQASDWREPFCSEEIRIWQTQLFVDWIQTNRIRC